MKVFSLPRIDDSLDVLLKSKFFTTLDHLASDFWQVKVEPSSREKTFITHLGLYEFSVIRFGLVNAPWHSNNSWSQYRLDSVVRKLMYCVHQCLQVYGFLLNSDYKYVLIKYWKLGGFSTSYIMYMRDMVQECQLLNARPVATIVLFNDSTTLSNTNLEHAQSHQHMADRHARFMILLVHWFLEISLIIIMQDNSSCNIASLECMV